MDRLAKATLLLELASPVLCKFSAENARLFTLWAERAETMAEVTHEALFAHWLEIAHGRPAGPGQRPFDAGSAHQIPIVDGTVALPCSKAAPRTLPA